jgi:hypothetical protein
MDLNDYPPPPAYHVPYTGPGVLVVLPLPQVNTICRLLGVKGYGDVVYSCSGWHVGGCLEIVSKVGRYVSKRIAREAVEMEDANCNGWPVGHRR